MVATYTNGTVIELRCDKCGKATDTLHRTNEWMPSENRPMWVCDRCKEALDESRDGRRI